MTNPAEELAMSIAEPLARSIAGNGKATADVTALLLVTLVEAEALSGSQVETVFFRKIEGLITELRRVSDAERDADPGASQRDHDEAEALSALLRQLRQRYELLSRIESQPV